MSTSTLLTVDPGRTALVIIDMQNDFCKPGGTRYGSESISDAGIARAARLLGRCREAGVKVIFVESIRDPDSPDFTRFKLSPTLMRGSWGAKYIEELSRRPDEPVVEKNTHDCFYETSMDVLLAKLGISPETHKIIVMGIAANVCVYHAIMGFTCATTSSSSRSTAASARPKASASWKPSAAAPAIATTSRR